MPTTRCDRRLCAVVLMAILVPVAWSQPPATPESAPPPLPALTSVPPENKPTTEVPLAKDPLNGLSEFPYVIVVESPDAKDLKDSRMVIIPWSEWMSKQGDTPSPSAQATAVTSVQLDVDTERDPARGKGTMGIRVDAKSGGWVNIGLAEVALNDIQLREVISSTDQPGTKLSEGWLPTLKDGADGYQVWIDRPGTYRADVDFFVDVAQMPLDRSVRLELPPAALTRIRLTHPTGFAFLRQTETQEEFVLSENRRSAEIALRGGKAFAATWREMNESSRKPAVNSVEGTGIVRLDERTLEMDATFLLDSRQEVREIPILLNASDRVIEAIPSQSGQVIVHETQVTDEPRGRRLLLKLSRPVSGRFQIRLVIERERDPNETALEIRLPDFLGTDLQSGVFAIQWAPMLWVRSRAGRGTILVNVNELPRELASLKAPQAYRFGSAQGVVHVAVQPAKPAFIVESQCDIRVEPSVMEIASKFQIRVQGAQADSLTFLVPSNIQKLEVLPSGIANATIGEVSEPSTTREVKITLAESVQDNSIQLMIRGEIPHGSSGQVSLPIPTLAGSPTIKGTVLVHADANVGLILDENLTTSLRRESNPNPGADAPMMRFRHQPGEPRLAFKLDLLPSEVETWVQTDVHRSHDLLEVRQIMAFRVEKSPLEEIVLQVPPGIQGLTLANDAFSGSPKLVEGSNRLRLRNPASSTELRIGYTISPNPTSNETAIPLIIPTEAVVRAWKGSVYCEPGGLPVLPSPWMTSSPDISPVIVSSDQPALHFRLPEDKEPIESLTIRFESTATLAMLVVPRVLIEEYVLSSGKRWGRKRWLIAKHRRRNIELHVPEGCRVIDVNVNSELATPVATSSRTFQVTLPALDEPCSMEVDYELNQDDAVGAIGHQRWLSPTLATDAGVEQVRWEIQAPSDRLMVHMGSMVGSRSFWENSAFRWNTSSTETTESLTWLQEAAPAVRWSDRVSPPTGGRHWRFDAFSDESQMSLLIVREPFWVLLCSGTALILVLAISRLSGIPLIRVGTIAALAVLALLAGVPEIVGWIWHGAQWGVYLGVLASLLHWWIAKRRSNPLVGIRRSKNATGPSSSLLRRNEPKTRVSTHLASRSG